MTASDTTSCGACALLVAIGLAACGADGPGGEETFTVTDSAGVRIVESVAPVWTAGDGWTVDPEPILTIGTVDGSDATVFDYIAAVRRLADGSLAVVDRGTAEIRVFDGAAGDHLRTFGRRGEGPGELQWVDALFVGPGDSVHVVETFPARISVFAPDGTFGRSWTADRPGLAVRVLPDGRLLSRASNPPVMRGHQQWITAFLRSGPGEPPDTLVAGLEGEETFLIQSGNAVINNQVHFGRAAASAADAGRIWFGNGDTYVVDVFDTTGARVAVLRRAVEPRPVAEGDVPRRIESGLVLARERGADEAALTETRRRLESAPARETMPAFDELVLDATGHLWVRRYLPPWDAPASRSWDAFHPDGHWLGAVELPFALDVHEIHEDRVIGVATDDLGVPRVGIHRLRRGG